MKIIPPVSAKENARLKVAAYARVSSNSADQMHSYYTQIMHYMTYINSVPEWELVDVYADEGLSGLRSDNRLEFQRMLQDCKSGRINRILTKSVSRFSRNKQQAFLTILELKELGVSVLFENDHIDTGDLSSTTLFSLAAALAEQESVEISRNVRMSIQSRMRRGTYIPGAVPYGYKRTNGQLVLNAFGAPVVQRIFGEYLSGAGIEHIVCKLNEDGITGPNGKGWNTCAIRYILTNRIYTGDCLWQKSFTTDTVPFHSQRNRGQQKQYLVHASHAPIITNKDFEAVERLFRERTERFANRPSTAESFHGILSCGECGARHFKKSMGITTRWTCNNHIKHECSSMPVGDFSIQESFINLYNTLSVNRTVILSSMLGQLQQLSQQIRCSDQVQALDIEILSLVDQNATIQEMRSKKQITECELRSSIDLSAQKMIELRAKRAQYLRQTEDGLLIDRTKQVISVNENGPEYLYAFDFSLLGQMVKRIEILQPHQFRFHLLNDVPLIAFSGQNRIPQLSLWLPKNTR